MKKTYHFEKADILLVDDKPENLLALEAVLSCPEYRLIKAESGGEALRYLLNNTPALILMDVQMPGMNGYEIASIIRGNERTREIPIIFITAINKDEPFVHEGYRYGAIDYIYKPYDTYVLKSKVFAFAEIKRQHGRVSRLVAVQQAATQSLAESRTETEAMSKVLQSICTSLDWDIGFFWKVDRQTNSLFCHTKWHEGYYAPVFLAAAATKVITPKMGLPGRAWANHSAIWIPEFAEDAEAAREGLNTAVAIPIRVQEQTLGVLEFYSGRNLREDEDLIKIMEAIGSQVGQFLKRTEAFEAAQDAIRTRDDFFSIASHELKTPITSLKMSIQLLQRDVKPTEALTPAPERLKKMLDISSKQVDRLTYLIEDLLDVVKIRAGKLSFNFAESNLSQIVGSVVEQFSEALARANCHLKLNIAPDVCGFWDPTRIEQIVTNLISNASKYAPGKEINIEVKNHGKYASLVVQDFGPGVPQDNQMKIFERFERAASSNNVTGLGLGLFIVKKIVGAHHGTIRLESDEGRGSTFIVELPKNPFECAAVDDDHKGSPTNYAVPLLSVGSFHL